MSHTVENMVAEVRAALREKLGLRGATLDAQLRKGGRLLPRYVRRDAAYLAQVMLLMQNPKLQRMIDVPKARKAHRNVLAHLESIDLAAQRRDAALNLVASIAFVVLATVVMVIGVAWWRGLI